MKPSGSYHHLIPRASKKTAQRASKRLRNLHPLYFVSIGLILSSILVFQHPSLPKIFQQKLLYQHTDTTSQTLSGHKLKLRTYPASTAIELYGYPNSALRRMIYEGLREGMGCRKRLNNRRGYVRVVKAEYSRRTSFVQLVEAP